jgi:hypothetical protein
MFFLLAHIALSNESLDLLPHTLLIKITPCPLKGFVVPRVPCHRVTVDKLQHLSLNPKGLPAQSSVCKVISHSGQRTSGDQAHCLATSPRAVGVLN